jgi:hypothetical protein
LKKAKLSEIEIDLEAVESLVDYLKYVIEFAIVAVIDYEIVSSIRESLNGVMGITPLYAVGIQWVAFFVMLLIYYRLVRVMVKIVIRH